MIAVQWPEEPLPQERSVLPPIPHLKRYGHQDLERVLQLGALPAVLTAQGGLLAYWSHLHCLPMTLPELVGC